MNLTRCSHGHFYDADTNASCPHCQQSKGLEETVAVVRNDVDDSVTVPLGNGGVTQTTGGQEKKKQPVGGTVTIPEEEDSKTISYNQATFGSEPVVGWLVCTEGPHFGEDFRLKSGKNFIGRASNMDASLTKDKSVSREKHAIVLYDPKLRHFLYSLANQESFAT